MRTRLFVHLLFITSGIIGACLLSSCSSDKATDDDVIVGDPNDPSYKQIQATVPMILGYGTGMVGGGVENVDGFDAGDFDNITVTGGWKGPIAVESESVYVIYYPISGWWFAYVHGDKESDAMIFDLTLKDSVQFRDESGRYQAEPDSTTDYFNNILRLDVQADLDTLGDVDVLVRAAIKFDDLQSEIITAAGSFYLLLEGNLPDTSGEMVHGYAMISLTCEGLQIPNQVTGDHCPTGGEIVYTLTENFSTQALGQGTGTSTWTVTVSIIDEYNYSVQITAGRVRWAEYTVETPCGRGFAAAGPLGHLLTFAPKLH